MAKTNKTVTLDQAAEIMDISKDALRKRIQRGTIEAVKDKAGKWRVIIPDSDRTNTPDESKTSPDKKDPGQDELIKALQDQITFYKQELERKDHILMALMQKVPQLEAPKKSSIWYRVFGRKPAEPT